MNITVGITVVGITLNDGGDLSGFYLLKKEGGFISYSVRKDLTSGPARAYPEELDWDTTALYAFRSVA